MCVLALVELVRRNHLQHKSFLKRFCLVFEKKQKQIEIKRSLKFLEFTGIAADCVIVDGIL